MGFGGWIVRASVARYRLVLLFTLIITLLVAVVAALPSFWTPASRFLHAVKVDTDPENMLSPDEPVRVFNNRMKKELALHDMVVVGIVNETHPDGVFNPDSLACIYELTQYAKTLTWEENGEFVGVIKRDLIAPSVVDSIEPGGPGEIRFEWLMRDPPATQAQALEVRRKAMRIPFLADTLVSADGRALALYLPLTRKDLSYRVYDALNAHIPVIWKYAALKSDLSAASSPEPLRTAVTMLSDKARSVEDFSSALAVLASALEKGALTPALKAKFNVYDIDPATIASVMDLPSSDRSRLAKFISDAASRSPESYPDHFYITGLPVAEDTFGVEMFIQMAISAPTAMLVIFILMFIFFRKVVVIISPLILAMVSVIITMGVLVIAGFPIHIMSSMIPIFIMPIAVLNSIHIISEFFEEYQKTRDTRETIFSVMRSLFLPMLYTSLTTATGFASLALTPIPPVQVFGVFVALGVMSAWFLTVTFIPAFVMIIPKKMLGNFGARESDTGSGVTSSSLARFLSHVGFLTYDYAKPILALALVVLVIAAWGISKITVNDNPINWFSSSHPIRVADHVLNSHFGGTYMAYLAMTAADEDFDPSAAAERLAAAAAAQVEKVKPDFSADVPVEAVFTELASLALESSSSARTADEFFSRLAAAVASRREQASGEASFVWDEAASLVEAEKQAASEVFKNPEVLAYQAQIQRVLASTGIVGKSNSLADIVKTVHRDLVSSSAADAEKQFRIPENSRMVAETLIQFQNSHRPQDLWHFVTPDFRLSSLWVQLKSGDNRDMSRVKAAVDTYIANYPPPLPIDFDWFGLTYINVVWQEKMVTGTLQAFSGSFLVVFLLMVILFRSALWGLLSMIPLTVTIAAIYGAVGIVGKDYDMPVAILSSLTLGLAVDFAIHFLVRGRVMYDSHGSWSATAPAVFGEPARAITRNIIVIAAGFLPLLLAPLVPYKTVGVFLATILLVSGIATLLLLPALVRILEKRLFTARPAIGHTCNCTLCIVSSVTLVALIALNLHQYAAVRWSTLTWLSIFVIPFFALICAVASRREKCRVNLGVPKEPSKENPDEDAS